VEAEAVEPAETGDEAGEPDGTANTGGSSDGDEQEGGHVQDSGGAGGSGERVGRRNERVGGGGRSKNSAVVTDLREKLVQREIREHLTYTIENEQAVMPEVQVQIENDRAQTPLNPRNMLTKIEGENFCLRCNSKRCDHCEELDFEPSSEDEAMAEVHSFLEGEEGKSESEDE
jgi:hypothetical protein